MEQDAPSSDSRAQAAAAAAALAAERRKGRGGRDDMEVDDRYAGKAGIFESLGGNDAGPQKCALGHAE